MTGRQNVPGRTAAAPLRNGRRNGAEPNPPARCGVRAGTVEWDRRREAAR